MFLNRAAHFPHQSALKLTSPSFLSCRDRGEHFICDFLTLLFFSVVVLNPGYVLFGQIAMCERGYHVACLATPLALGLTLLILDGFLLETDPPLELALWVDLHELTPSFVSDERSCNLWRLFCLRRKILCLHNLRTFVYSHHQFRRRSLLTLDGCGQPPVLCVDLL